MYKCMKKGSWFLLCVSWKCATPSPRWRVSREWGWWPRWRFPEYPALFIQIYGDSMGYCYCALLHEDYKKTVTRSHSIYWETGIWEEILLLGLYSRLLRTERSKIQNMSNSLVHIYQNLNKLKNNPANQSINASSSPLVPTCSWCNKS